MSFSLTNTYFFRANVERTEKLRFGLILMFVFSLPFNLFYSSVIFSTLSILSIIDLNKLKLKRIPKQFWIFQAVYFLALLGYGYSLHKNVASFFLERQLTILLFPLILPIAINVTAEKLKTTLLTLTISCLISIMYLFMEMGYTIKYGLQLPIFQGVFSGLFFNHDFSKPIGIHASYFSLYISMSIIYILSLFSFSISLRIRIILFSCLFILFSGLLFLASRNTIITTSFILLFIFPIFKLKNKIRYILIASIAIICSFFAFKNIPYFKARFSNELISDIRPLTHGGFINYSTTEPRIERWKCSVTLIKKSILFGYGTGDEVEMLKSQYAKEGLFISYLENFNAHNQYLSIWIKNGLVGLILFLLIFFYYFRLAIKRKDFIYFSFLILLIIGFYTENILDANKGILFFAFFNTFFGYNLLSFENTSNPHVIQTMANSNIDNP